MLIGVDVGGTFTDAVLVSADGTVHDAKVPTSSGEQATGVLAAVDAVLAAAGARAADVTLFAHGMTVATNALLEGRTARTALVATEGFSDVIELGRQARPELYRLDAHAPAPLVPAALRFGAPERMTPDGPLRVLDPDDAKQLAYRVAAEAPQAVAIALLHSYADASHELSIARALAAALPGVHVSVSSDLVGTFREFERTATTVLDAALSPVLAGYLEPLARDARARGLPEPKIMQSSGGLTERARAADHAALTVLSGPAGGVAGATLLATLAGEPSVLCFDMGGTSCDVCLITDGRISESAERLVASRPLALPALDIHTVGAGGGSIARRDGGGALRVGPQSAGADPGPACYGRGGTAPTVTDANLLLGRLVEDAPLAAGVRLDSAAAAAALAPLAAELELPPLACAEGVLRVAEAEMLAALRLMTLERGIDPRSLALLSFGGAGPLHATALAEELAIRRVLCPRASGVLSALGLAAAAPRRDVSRTVKLRLADRSAQTRIDTARDALLASAMEALGEPAVRARIRHEVRYRGQSYELPVDEDLEPSAPRFSATTIRERFDAAHRERYGYEEPAEVELVTVRATVWGAERALRPAATPAAPATRRRHALRLDGEAVACELLIGEPREGTRIEGPALWALPHATLLVRPGWAGAVDRHGTIVLEAGG